MALYHHITINATSSIGLSTYQLKEISRQKEPIRCGPCGSYSSITIEAFDGTNSRFRNQEQSPPLYLPDGIRDDVCTHIFNGHDIVRFLCDLGSTRYKMDTEVC